MPTPTGGLLTRCPGAGHSPLCTPRAAHHPPSGGRASEAPVAWPAARAGPGAGGRPSEARGRLAAAWPTAVLLPRGPGRGRAGAGQGRGLQAAAQRRRLLKVIFSRNLQPCVWGQRGGRSGRDRHRGVIVTGLRARPPAPPPQGPVPSVEPCPPLLVWSGLGGACWADRPHRRTRPGC